MRWAAVLLVAATIFYLSVVIAPPEDPLAPKPPIALDKWRHFLAYGALSAAVGYALADRRWRTVAVVAVGVGATVAYGVGIEGVQSQLPNRYFSWGDALANALGGLLAAPVYGLLRRARLDPVLESWPSQLR